MQRLTITALTLLVTACSGVSPEQSAIENQADMIADNMEAMANNIDAMTAVDAAPTTTPTTGWVYEQSDDRMRGAKNRRASVDAVESITLPFPYGESVPTLNIREDAKYGFNIYLRANGQFLCRSYQDDTLSVKFDSRPIREWSCAEADGGGSEIVFINRERAFLAELKKASEVTIEAPMYEAGRQQMTFKVAGLKW